MPIRPLGLEQAASNFGDLRQRNPLECVVDVAGEARAFDAILRREPGGVLLVELEIAYGERPFSFPNTYQAVRSSVEELNQAATLTELYEVTARAVRDLTGFDRVMVYRYDEEYNGEVVAECKREDLNSFLGLHYPSTDIPAQARALYEKNWMRLISDVDYTPAPLVPAIDPATGTPLDLTHATLRSVSPSTSSTCRTWVCTRRCRSRYCGGGGCGGSSPATTTPVRICRRSAPGQRPNFSARRCRCG